MVIKLIGAAVIGLGVGLAHCRAYEESEDAKLLAVCDLLDKRLSKAKSAFPKVDLYKDYGELLKRDDIDVVSIAVPNFLHAKVALDAIEAGKNVFLEKPMAFTLEECNEIVRAALKNDVKITIDFELRFSPVFRDIKKLIDDGKIGRVASTAIYWWRIPFHGPFKPGKWGEYRKFAGNMLFEEAIHWFDMLRWYGGEVTEVHCLTNDWVRKEIKYEQTAFVNFNYRSGAVGQISQTINGFETHGTIWTIGTKGSVLASITYSPFGNQGVMRYTPHPENIVDEYRGISRIDNKVEYIVKTRCFGDEVFEIHAMERHIQRFVEDIVEDREPLVTGEDGRKSVELCLAAEMSARNNEPVRLPLRKSPDFALDRAREGIEDREDYLKLVQEWPYIKEWPF